MHTWSFKRPLNQLSSFLLKDPAAQIEKKTQLAVARSPGIDEDVFIGSDEIRTIVFNRYSLESLFCAAILANHLGVTKVRSKALDTLILGSKDQRHLWLGINATEDLKDLLGVRRHKNLNIQTLNTDDKIPVDETGIGPSLLTDLAVEFGVRTDRYEKLLYRAQRFFRMDAEQSELVYVYKNAQRAIEALNKAKPFAVLDQTQEDNDNYSRDFREMQNNLSHEVRIIPAIDGRTQVKVACVTMDPLPFMLAKRLFNMIDLHYFNRQSNTKGTMVFTDMRSPVMADDADKVALIRC